MQPGDLNPATGNDLTHTVHYAGQQFGILPEHAQLLSQALTAATRGTMTMLRMKATQLSSGETVERQFLVGPGIALLIVGPPLD